VTLGDKFDSCAPQLYRFACALVAGQAGSCGQAADLVHAVLSSPLQGSIARRLAGDSLRIRLYSVLIEWHRRGLKRGSMGYKVQSELGCCQITKWNVGGNASVKSSRQDDFAAALLDIGLEEREALLLVALEGFSYAQAAQILKISRSVLVSRLARARTALGEIGCLEHLAQPAKPRPSYLRLVK
jgi:RNA polymerase sigma-70 factor (ECF subfamily)